MGLIYWSHQSRGTTSILIAFSTAKIKTPTSAKIANHIFAIPKAPSIRHATLMPKPKNDIIKPKRSVIHLGKKENISNYEFTKTAPAQDKHVVGTNSYKNLSETKSYPPSYLTIPQHKVPELVTKYAGKGVHIVPDYIKKKKGIRYGDKRF